MSLLTEGQHGLKAHSDTLVPVQTRSERFTSTDPTAFPEVTGRELEWKLSPVPVLRPLIDGDLDGARYDVRGGEGSTATIEWIGREEARIGQAGSPEDRASANAWAAFGEALAITVSSEEQTDVVLTRSGFGSAGRAAHTVITATPNSRGLVILGSTGPARLAENVEIVVEEGAHLTVVSLQEWDDDALHTATHFATVGRDASLKHIVVSLGGAVVRVNPSVHLAGDGADGELYGLYFADAGQHIEQQVYLHHAAQHTRGRVNYKGALQGASARTVWVGDVLIGPDAVGTDSYEQNRNLVLTEGTRADSIPNLEIENGDILGAGHASATGRFDDEQLFYLQARGITEPEARRLVVIGFLAEIVQKIGDPALEQRLHAAIERELAGGAR
jgi:Fe-S cluster assembly protein SufD